MESFCGLDTVQHNLLMQRYAEDKEIERLWQIETDADRELEMRSDSEEEVTEYDDEYDDEDDNIY